MKSRGLFCVMVVLGFMGVGSGPAQAQEVETVLRLKERVSMEKLAQEVTDPRSPRYRKFYTPEEIRAVAAPSDTEYSGLLAGLRLRGFRVVSESKSHLFVTVTADHSLYEQTFAAQIDFSGVAAGRHRSLQTPRIPAELGWIASISGLDNTRSSRHPLIRRASSRQGGGLEPDSIKNMYGFEPIYKAGLTGKGQHIAIATYDGYFPQDIQWYWGSEGIQPTPHLDTVEFNGHALVNVDSSQETGLDAEFSGALAPGAQIHVFTSAHNDDPGEVQLFTAILDDNRAKVANYSWGDCEPNVSKQHAADMNQVFARAVAQGVNITIAAGDWGAAGCPTQVQGAAKLNADWPAANGYVVAVGGTSIEGGSSGEVKESTWDLTGGGVSILFDRPSWQAGFPAPYDKRSFPDVAFNADPNTGQNALIHLDMANRDWFQIGGTSIGAPQWAAFLALVGEARAGKSGLGYLNPVIYALSADQKKRGFHDITHGNNGGYAAGPGWDATTGWGSMRASALLDLLKNH